VIAMVPLTASPNAAASFVDFWNTITSVQHPIIRAQLMIGT
jgi:hypothetical protein